MFHIYLMRDEKVTHQNRCLMRTNISRTYLIAYQSSHLPCQLHLPAISAAPHTAISAAPHTSDISSSIKRFTLDNHVSKTGGQAHIALASNPISNHHKDLIKVLARDPLLTSGYHLTTVAYIQFEACMMCDVRRAMWEWDDVWISKIFTTYVQLVDL